MESGGRGEVGDKRGQEREKTAGRGERERGEGRRERERGEGRGERAERDRGQRGKWRVLGEMRGGDCRMVGIGRWEREDGYGDGH